MGVALVSFGQVNRKAAEAPVYSQSVTDLGTAPAATKGGGEIFWQNTFNWENAADPRGWSYPEGWTVADGLGEGRLFIWTKDTVRGQFTTVAPPSFFKTRADGFLSLPMDFYNSKDGVFTNTPMDATITTSKIDCSAKSSVVVRFSQYFRLCCSDYNLKLRITIDGGIRWATYDVRFNVGGNTFTPERFRQVEINISDIAAGSADVQLQFYTHGQGAYFWIIDDLSLSEAYSYDLVLEDTWLMWDGGYETTMGHINYWPKTQMGMAGSVSGTVGQYFFTGALLNNGMEDQVGAKVVVDVMKNGSVIHTEESPAKTIWALERDTLDPANPYLATDYGDYRFVFKAVSTLEEQVPANNQASIPFTVNDTLFHRADFTAESSANTGGWVGGNNAGDMVGVTYFVYAPTEVKSLTAYISGYTAAQNPQFQFVLLKMIDGVREEWLVTDVYDCDATTLRWVTKEIFQDGESEFIQPGEYAACVRMWGEVAGDADGVNGLSIGWDMTTKAAYTLMYQAVGGNWYSTGKLNMIGFNINETGAPTEAPATFNVNMTNHITSGEFVPGTDFVDLAGSFNGWTGSAHLVDADGDGIYTITIDGLPVGQVIEFKYRINGNWDTSEFPDGGPNRTYTVRYWNVLNHTYNNGQTTGIKSDSLVASFNVYPNPTSGNFTVNVVNTIPSNLEITLVDIQGHVVYRNMVKNATEHTETIDNQLAKGMYFLTINNGREVKVQKVVVR
jgi:hypothetical protein